MINLSRKVLCLDWDKRSLRIVVARAGAGRMALEDAHSHRLPADVDADDPQAMGEFIKQMLRRHRLRYKWVLVDVPRERAVINRLTLPPTPAHEVAAAVRFQAMRELPFPLESAAADFVITARNEKGLTTEALLAAVTLETLDRVRATCSAAGLTPTRIGLRPYASLVAAQRVQDLTDRRVLFVDLGPGATEIDVFHGDALAFARSANVNVPVPVGNSSAKEDSRVISLAEIAELESSDDAIEVVVDELLLEVTRTLTAYRATESEGAIDAAIVAGGTGIETQFADALGRRLGYSVELFDPTEPLGVEPGEASKLRSFSAALGLAWGLSREGLLALDFLNPKKATAARDAMRRRMRLIGLGVAALLVLVVGSLGYWYRNLSQERDALLAANRTLKSQVDEKTKVLHQVERAEEWQVGAVWPEDLLAITQAAIDPGKKMLVRAIDLDGINLRLKLRDVYATDFQVLQEFADALNALEADGNRLYEATLKTWTELGGDASLQGKRDVEIRPLRLARHEEETQKNEQSRKSRKR